LQGEHIFLLLSVSHCQVFGFVPEGAGILRQHVAQRCIAAPFSAKIITPMPGAGTTKDENGVVAIKGESR